MSAPTILVVDDDEALRYALERLLRGAGYEVVHAPDYREALVFIETGAPIDLLLVDVMMPGRISGLSLARMARMRRFGLRVIYMTGFDIDTSGAAGPVLRKPLDEHALLATVTSVLAAPMSTHRTETTN